MKKMDSKVSKAASAKEKKKAADDEKKTPAKKAAENKKKLAQKKTGKPPKKSKAKADSDSDKEQNADAASRRVGSSRNAARKAASRISLSAAEWAPPAGDSDSDNFESDAKSSDDDGSDSGNESSSEAENYCDSSSDDSAFERAREKQRQALEMTKGKKKPMPNKKQPAAPKANGKKAFAKKPAARGKGMKKNFDDDSDGDYSSTGYNSDDDVEQEIDMAALIQKAMSGAKNSILHSLCWWRIILGKEKIHSVILVSA